MTSIEYVKEDDNISVIQKTLLGTKTNFEMEKKELEELLNLTDKQIKILQSYCQFGNFKPPKKAMQERIDKITEIINNAK